MAYANGLSQAQVKMTERQMVSPYRVRHGLRLVDLMHRPIQDLSDMRTAGNVQVNATTEGVTRSLSLDLYDPTDVLNLSSAEVTTAGMNRMIEVTKGIYVEEMGAWADFPVFAGPISKPKRQGDVLVIEAQDKASMALDEGRTFVARKGWNAGTAIRKIMADLLGETRFRIASTATRLGRDYAIGEGASPWSVVQAIARSLGWVAFYDAAGYLVCRPRSTTSVFTFAAGPQGSLLGGIEFGYWDRQIYNRVRIKGGKISKVQIIAIATVAAAHPLAPGKLGRSGKARFLTRTITDTSIKTFAAATALASRKVNELAVQQLSASGEAVPIWHLQEYDTVTVIDPDSGASVRTSLTEFTIPLTCAGTMALGYASRSARSRLAARVAPKSSSLRAAERRDRAARRKAAARKRRRK